VTQTAIHMMSIDEAAEASGTCRSTITNRIKLWDEAVKAGKTPPPGALESTKWVHRRLIRDTWLARALGLGLDEGSEASSPRRAGVPADGAAQPS
jgi:hypothetical protein